MKKRLDPFVFIISVLLFPTAITLRAQKEATSPVTLSAKQKVVTDAGLLRIPAGYTKNLHWNLPLDSAGKNGSAITWKSGNTTYISNTGKLLKRSPRSAAKVKVNLTATITAGPVKQTKSFSIYIAHEEPWFDGYLFAYFEGSGPRETQEQLRFAASADAVHWNALNNNQPIIASAAISGTGGIRDPHILRGEDEKTFYQVATDMFTVKNGWEHNPGIVLLKSEDLIHWTHGIIDLQKSYPQQFPDVKWVWAPQTIYDPSADKYLMFTMFGRYCLNLGYQTYQ